MKKTYIFGIAAVGLSLGAFFLGRNYPTSEAVFRAEEERRATDYAHVEKDLADMVFFGVDNLRRSKENIAQTVVTLRQNLPPEEISRYESFLSSLERRVSYLDRTQELFRQIGQRLDYREERGGIGGDTLLEQLPLPLRETQKSYYLDPEGKDSLQKYKRGPQLLQDMWDAAQCNDQESLRKLRGELESYMGKQTE